MKQYMVYFFVKANCTEFLAQRIVEAPNAKEACKVCKDWYHQKTGKNAFRPTTKLDESDIAFYGSRGRRLFF